MARPRGGWLFASLRHYDLSWLPGDAIAGLTLAAIAIPEQLATARLVGLPPVTGLLAFAAGSLAFAAFGANRFMSVGADSTIAPIMAGGLAMVAVAGTAHYSGITAVLALLVGLVLLLAGLLRAGWIADLLSVPVTAGFLAGISVHIIVGQLPTILGLEAPHGHLVVRLGAILRELPHSNLYPMAIGLGVLAVTMLAEQRSARIPGALIGLVASGLAVWLMGLEHRGVAVLGALPIAPPTFALVLPTWSEFTQLLPVSLIVALVCMMQTAAVVQSFPSEPGEQEDVSRDFGALGAGSILAAVLGAFAVNSSPPRTAVVHESGGRSQLASLLAIAIIVAIVLLAAGAFAVVPQAALSGVLVFIGMRIFRVATMREIYRRGGWEILLVVASAALVVLLPMETGVTMSIVLSLLHSIYIIARPGCAVLARVPGTTVWWSLGKGEAGEHEPGVLVFAPGAPINFTNAAYVRGRLNDAIGAMAEPCRLVVIEANGVIYIDFTGSGILQQLITDLRGRGIDVAVARLESDRAQRAAARSGLIAQLGDDHVFRSVEDAIRSRQSAVPRSTA
jgi:MFS superfamily sulfate permease-like transporter